MQVMESGHPGAAWEEGAGQGPRAKQDSELLLRAEMEQMGHLRTKCVWAGGGLWSQQRRWHVL